MIKSELVARLAERYPHLYHRDVERIVSTVLDEIAKALSDGDRVELMKGVVANLTDEDIIAIAAYTTSIGP